MLAVPMTGERSCVLGRLIILLYEFRRGREKPMLTVSNIFTTLLGAPKHDRPAKVRVIVGACEDRFEGWIATDKGQLDLLREADWDYQFGPNSVDAILAEHVWEHLDCNAAIVATQNCFNSLKPGGYIRGCCAGWIASG